MLVHYDTVGESGIHPISEGYVIDFKCINARLFVASRFNYPTSLGVALFNW